jgi:ureidoglycolate lyase
MTGVPPLATLAAAALSATALTGPAPEPLAAAAFRPFGEVIEVPRAAPTMEYGVYRYWGGLAMARIAEQVEFGMLKIRSRPREIAEMERHARSPKFLVCLTGGFLLAVAPKTLGTKGPRAADVRIFRVAPQQAVLLHKGVWHAWPFPDGADEALFLVAFREQTAHKDVTTRTFRRMEVVRF